VGGEWVVGEIRTQGKSFGFGLGFDNSEIDALQQAHP
jgi:hypothetical protein